MNLAETQRLLWDLLHGRERPLDAFVGSPDLPAAERVAIYTRMFVDRQVDALRETFPKVLAALGDEEFHRVAARYVDAHPSEHPDIGQLGRKFAEFLERRDLSDLARLEWARGEVFEAAMAESLSPERFATLAQDAVAFARYPIRLIPALRLLELEHQIDPLWEGSARAAEPQPTRIVVWLAGSSRSMPARPAQWGWLCRGPSWAMSAAHWMTRGVPQKPCRAGSAKAGSRPETRSGGTQREERQRSVQGDEPAEPRRSGAIAQLLVGEPRVGDESDASELLPGTCHGILPFSWIVCGGGPNVTWQSRCRRRSSAAGAGAPPAPGSAPAGRARDHRLGAARAARWLRRNRGRRMPPARPRTRAQPADSRPPRCLPHPGARTPLRVRFCPSPPRSRGGGRGNRRRRHRPPAG